jgi:WhiB family redox-sensing transcriptional regulator
VTAPTAVRTCADCLNPLEPRKSNRGRCARCFARHKRAGTIHLLPAPQRRPATVTAAARQDLAAMGLSNAQVAEHLGITVEGLESAIRRAEHGYRRGVDTTPAGPDVGPNPAHGDRRAACRDEDPELFFLDHGVRGPAKDQQIERAKAVCRRCPLVDACGRWALDTRQEYGVFGGMSEEDRQAIWQAGIAPQAAA